MDTTPPTLTPGAVGGANAPRGLWSWGGRTADALERRSVERALTMGAFVWPAFTLVDLYLGLVVYPGAPVALFLAFRVFGQILILGGRALSRHPTVPSRVLKLGNACICAVCSLMISCMALWFGGLESAYVHGLSIVILVEAVAVPAPWRDTLLYSMPSVLSFLLLLPFAREVMPTVAAQLADRTTVSDFVAQYSMVLSTMIVAAVSGQTAYGNKVELERARRVGRYRLEAPLGRGNVNEVWLAWDEVLERQVALKILRSGEGASRARARFEREALALSKLTSDNTVRIFDFGASDDGFSYIAMEYLPGADLQKIVRAEGALELRRALELTAGAARSLAEAHAAGIVHRDIKPANLLAVRGADERELLKVLDFGIARSLALDATQTEQLAGTPAFMAPEAFWSAQADPRSDVYSLGATLYYLLTGAAPFQELEPARLPAAHAIEVPPRIEERLGVPVPPEVEGLVARCLAKEPEARFPSMEELGRAIQECLERLRDERGFAQVG